MLIAWILPRWWTMFTTQTSNSFSLRNALFQTFVMWFPSDLCNELFGHRMLFNTSTPRQMRSLIFHAGVFWQTAILYRIIHLPKAWHWYSKTYYILMDIWRTEVKQSNKCTFPILLFPMLLLKNRRTSRPEFCSNCIIQLFIVKCHKPSPKEAYQGVAKRENPCVVKVFQVSVLGERENFKYYLVVIAHFAFLRNQNQFGTGIFSLLEIKHRHFSTHSWSKNQYNLPPTRFLSALKEIGYHRNQLFKTP